MVAEPWPVDDPHLGDLLACLSPARLGPYLGACGQDRAPAVRLYEWNARVSAAFWEILEGVEVVVRNAMHHELQREFGERWFDQPLFDERTRRHLEEGIDRAGRALRPGVAPSPSKVVSELSFGTWVGLVDKGGYRAGQRIHYEQTLWVPAISKAFPHGLRHRGKTHAVLRRIQTLRNRIAHHEKIFVEPVADTGQTLAQLHDMCIAAAGWIAPVAQVWLRERSTVPAILAARP